ncbi:MAG: hypothetical protein JXM70_23335, partial [Pirellulales bacterium]|nr:hypothetical protein [Pirellulales bacterium]
SKCWNGKELAPVQSEFRWRYIPTNLSLFPLLAGISYIHCSSARPHPMQNVRDEFRDFLLRLADNNLRANDWNTFAVQHYTDEEIEQLRQALVKRSLDFPDWQIGWIPRAFQDAARGLAECLRGFDENSIRYWTEWSEIGDDGIIHIKVTWFDSESHSTGVCDISPENGEYGFWKWLISDNELRRGRKSKTDVELLKSQYVLTK